MQSKFAIELILLLLIFLGISISQQKETPDLGQIFTKQISLSSDVPWCISYRHVPCEVQKTSDFMFYKESEETFIKLENQCLFYRYIPCQTNWNALTIVYENDANFLQRENTRMIEKAWQCELDQIREKNESGVLLEQLDEEKQYLNLNFTGCLNENRNQASLFESQIEDCKVSNQSLRQEIVSREASKSAMKSDLVWCLTQGKNQTSSLEIELQNCQQITSFSYEANSTCISEKMKTEWNYTKCLSGRKNESMQFDIDFKNCQDEGDSISVKASSCKAENKKKELDLIKCQSEKENKTLLYNGELEKCQNLNNSSNVKFTSCMAKQIKLQSNWIVCFNEGKKNTLTFKDEIEKYQALNYSLHEKILNCETEKKSVLSSWAKCSNEVVNRTSIMDSKVNQLQDQNTVLNGKVLSCNTELAATKSNITQCLDEQKTKTIQFQTKIKNCRDARYSINEVLGTCETENKQVEVNLTRCLIETENTTAEWFNIEGKKFELLTNARNESAFACSIEKKKLESNLTRCFIDFQNKVLSLEEDIRKYQSLNNSLSEKIIACNIEKSGLTTQVNGCLLDASNITKLLEAALNQYQNMTSVLNENVTSCDVEKSRIMSKLSKCLSEQGKRTTLSPTELWNRERNLLIDYMASWWNGTTFPIVNIPPSYESINVYIRYNVVRMGLSPITAIQTFKPVYGVVINDVLSFEYHLDIPECSIPPSIRSIFIAVITSAPNSDRRSQIRYNFVSYIKAAAQKTPPIIIHFGFFMGVPEDSRLQAEVVEESDTFGDIVQIEMDDTHRNSPMKMAAVLNWVNRKCATVDLIFKMEEEAKITISSMANFLKTWYTANNNMFGKPANTIPSRSGKRNITIQEYPWNNYPDYYDGSTYYILHGSTVRPLLAAMQTTPFFPLEDVYVTGICRVKAGISRMNCAQNDRSDVCFA